MFLLQIDEQGGQFLSLLYQLLGERTVIPYISAYLHHEIYQSATNVFLGRTPAFAGFPAIEKMVSFTIFTKHNQFSGLRFFLIPGRAYSCIEKCGQYVILLIGYGQRACLYRYTVFNGLYCKLILSLPKYKLSLIPTASCNLMIFLACY